MDTCGIPKFQEINNYVDKNITIWERFFSNTHIDDVLALSADEKEGRAPASNGEIKAKNINIYPIVM